MKTWAQLKKHYNMISCAAAELSLGKIEKERVDNILFITNW